jgi:hypothetical protein
MSSTGTARSIACQRDSWKSTPGSHITSERDRVSTRISPRPRTLPSGAGRNGPMPASKYGIANPSRCTNAVVYTFVRTRRRYHLS